jgi:hypothetical protein
MTVAELGRRMDSAEFAEWSHYYREFGFDADRLEYATANAGAAVCQSWGGKVRANQLVPRFGPPAPPHPATIHAWLNSLTPDRFLR